MVIRSAAGKPLFGDVIQRKRYFYAMLMILLMIGVAEWFFHKWLLSQGIVPDERKME